MFITVRPNFVDIVGYQFEKVHTGAIKWLLDSSNKLIDKHRKIKCASPIYIKRVASSPFQKFGY